MHGYQLITEIGERSEGEWTPSPGSVYPVLQQLEDEGLITFERVEGRKTAQLTEAGRAYLEEHRETFGTPWQVAEGRGGPPARESAESLRSLIGAWTQVMQAGTDEQRQQASEILADARKSLYRVLADA